jgi:hypothetical protein
MIKLPRLSPVICSDEIVVLRVVTVALKGGNWGTAAAKTKVSDDKADEITILSI